LWVHYGQNEMAIRAITLAELSTGPHQVRPNGEQDMYDEHEERARHHAPHDRPSEKTLAARTSRPEAQKAAQNPPRVPYTCHARGALR
jgi:hypothetical protein